jgi:uncharacterized cupin superfamily protein
MSFVVHEDQIEVIPLPGRDLKWLYTPKMRKAKGLSMNCVSIKPGQTVTPAHSHPKHEEVVYIVSGKGKAFIDGVVHDISAGAAVLFSAGAIHMLRNTGKVSMKVVCFFAPQATLKDYKFHRDVVFPEET